MNSFRAELLRIRWTNFLRPCLLTFVFLIPLFFGASLLYGEHLPVKAYLVADGLLRDTVYKIKQDSRGFLWFCTTEGISRFDGYGFTNFTAADGLPEGAINDFLETRDGKIFIATDNGLAKLDTSGTQNSNFKIQTRNRSLFSIIKPENPGAKAILVLFEDNAGKIFIGTSDGLFLLNGRGEIEEISLGKSAADLKPISVRAIIQDRRGAIWIGTSGDLFRLETGGNISRFTIGNDLKSEGLASLFEDRDGNLWAGMRGFGRVGLLLLSEPGRGTILKIRFPQN